MITQKGEPRGLAGDAGLRGQNQRALTVAIVPPARRWRQRCTPARC